MTTDGSGNAALAHLRVLDLGGPAAQFAARLLGDLGADVIKIEPPGGDPLRAQAPFAGGEPGPERSIPFIGNNHNKRSVVLDFGTEDSRAAFRTLATTADVVLESFEPGYLDGLGLGYDELDAQNPGLIVASVSPYGRFGPRRDHVGTELTVQAMTAVMYIHGDGETRPCIVPAEQLHHVAGYHTFIGITAALHARRATGRGQQVDISMQDVGLWQLMMTIGTYSFSQTMGRRVGSAPSNPGISIFEARDGGFVQTSPYMDHHMTRLGKWMNEPALPEDLMADAVWRRANVDLIDALMVGFVARHDRDAFVAEAQEKGIPSTPILRVSEFVNHPQPNSRDWFQHVAHPVVGEYLTAGAPYRMSETPWRIRRPAPRLGEHTAEVLAETRPPVPAGAQSNGVATAGGPPVKPLNGMRVVDFTQAVAGPVTTSFLAFLGADVVKVETSARPQARRPEQPGFAELNRNKRSVTINAQTPDGLDVVRRLVAQSDVVIDNWRAGVMNRMQLGYDELRSVKPDIIAVQMPGLGLNGPFHHYTTYGQQIFGFSGLGYIWGHPESAMTTRPKLGYTDYIAASATVGAILTALEHRTRTGTGQFIEVPQIEALAAALETLYMDYSINGTDAEPRGNYSDRFAPHDVFACMGVDSWCAIVCRDDSDWQKLVIAMESPEWAQDARWQTFAGRLAGRIELNALIGEWTATMTAKQVFDRCQRHGVPAGVDQSPDLLTSDHHLRARGSLATVAPPAPWDVGPPLLHPALSARLSRTPGSSDTPAPTEGRDNDDVFRRVIGLTDDEITRLTESGALV